MFYYATVNFIAEIFAEVSFKKHMLSDHEDKGLQLNLYKTVDENKTTGRGRKREFNELEVNNYNNNNYYYY